ncbi:TIGR04211 family SH3 domain-containing protein [Desulfolithobacter sp.]
MCRFLLFLRYVPVVMVIVLLWSGAAMAEIRYVKPSLEVPVRRGQGMEYRIVVIVNDGTRVELLEEQGDWARIRTEKGKEGWILKRYLSTEPPLDQVVARLKKENRNLLEKQASFEQRIASLKASMQKEVDLLQAALQESESQKDGCLAELDTVHKQYEALKRDAANVVQTRQQLEDTRLELEEIRQRYRTVEDENRRLRKNTSIKWFLAGSGVLLIGWLIGLGSGRSRKRRSSLL